MIKMLQSSKEETTTMATFISKLWLTLHKPIKNILRGTSLVIQWLRLHAPNAGGPGSIPGQGTRYHMPQLRVRMPQLKKDPACHDEDPTCLN